MLNPLRQSLVTVLIATLKMKSIVNTLSPSSAIFSKYLYESSKTFKDLYDKYPVLVHQCFMVANDQAVAKVKGVSFLEVTLPSGSKLLLDTKTGLLWRSDYSNNTCDVAQGNSEVKLLDQIENVSWQLPHVRELCEFAFNTSCPWRSGGNGRLFGNFGSITSGGYHDLDAQTDSVSSNAGKLYPVNDAFRNNLALFVYTAAKNGWLAGNVDSEPQLSIAAFSQTDFLSNMFKSIDTRSAKLPLLENADFTDPNKGLWEFWGMDADGLEECGLRARNQADDVQQGMVAIDFGTSSTVVAYEQNGVGTLLRIGVADFWEPAKPLHYENPTVLEMIDFEGLLAAWQTQAYRPDVLWGEQVRCSHEALDYLRNSGADPEVVASILSKIKQWALREGDGTRVRITDREGMEHELAPLTLRQPVKGQPLVVGDKDPFDPVELYAWFLGLTINWRRRGIFLRYYMTFPVDYPKVVKDKILASFRRGLQRSLPETLVAHPVFGHFVVEERASEPAAYAAAAMPALGIEPTDDGVAYAVFDFGGGTTDFDFGYYRLPTDTEERKGIEQVFEHFGSGGDKFLGGENLLEHMAYLTFRHNIELCRTNKIAFTRPQDAEIFTGSEMFLERTQAAATNSVMLASRLRKFWESGEVTNSTGIEKIDLLPREGKAVPCEFELPYAELKVFLQNRIEEGVKNFFTKMEKAFTDRPVDEVQVLLAGNAARSAIVLGLFDLLPELAELPEGHETEDLSGRTATIIASVFGQNSPKFIPHAPLAADERRVNAPTGKTGVALGLLKLCPGSATLVVNHAKQQANGDAPFQHFVGRIRREKFHPSLHQGGAYETWVELGPVGTDRVFKLFHTQAARALGGDMMLGDAALILHTLEFAGESDGQQVFARPVNPHEIEICTALSLEVAQNNSFENLKTLKLG
jgi:hypothetical protein